MLRVGRNTAYREANAFERSGGRTGIAVVRYGKLLRVPRCRLEEQLGGPLTWPIVRTPASVLGRPGTRVPSETPGTAPVKPRYPLDAVTSVGG